MKSALGALKAEAAYSIAETAYVPGILFEMKELTDIPAAAELSFMGLRTGIAPVPAMNVEGMQVDVRRAMAAASFRRRRGRRTNAVASSDHGWRGAMDSGPK